MFAVQLTLLNPTFCCILFLPSAVIAVTVGPLVIANNNFTDNQAARLAQANGIVNPTFCINKSVMPFKGLFLETQSVFLGDLVQRLETDAWKHGSVKRSN